MSKDNRLNKLNRYPVIILLAAVILSFIIFEFAYMPHDYDNMGGKHIWVTGSTIKFVNMWLEEGAANLHFTNYELFPSIELNTMEDRQPYVSYPTGVTFMVWSAAKLCGRSRIDISWLKHYQMLLYGVETILMSLLIYVLVRRINRCAGETSGIDSASNAKNVIIAYLISVFWMTLPVNNWFMTNIFWTDIAVLLWVIAFLLLESISDKEKCKGKLYKAVIIAKGVVIFAGVMTEYYFCIVVFIAFIINIARVILDKKTLQKVKGVIVSSLQYVVPVILAILVFLWQVSYTSNWLEQLLDTFLHRTGAENNEASFDMLIENFSQAITCGSRKRLLLFGVAICAIAVMGILNIIKAKLLTKVVADKAATVLGLLIMTPVVQMTIFSNHSAIHQYAMVKVGFVITGLLVAMVYVVHNIKSRYVRTGYVLITIGLILLAMGYPGQPRKFYFEKYEELNYDIAEAVYQQTGYSDVCMSFTYVIEAEPPMDISVSEQCIYEITDEDQLQNIVGHLPSGARPVLVVDKNNIGSNDFVDRDKTEYINSREEMYLDEGEIIYEDENCILVDISKCIEG